MYYLKNYFKKNLLNSFKIKCSIYTQIRFEILVLVVTVQQLACNQEPKYTLTIHVHLNNYMLYTKTMYGKCFFLNKNIICTLFVHKQKPLCNQFHIVYNGFLCFKLFLYICPKYINKLIIIRYIILYCILFIVEFNLFKII